MERKRVKTFERESAIFVKYAIEEQFVTISTKCYIAENQPFAGGFSDKYLSIISAAVRTNLTQGRTL